MSETMPVPRSLSDRVKKYTAKYNPDTIKTRLTQVQQIAEDRLLDALPWVVTIREATRNILESTGVPAGLHAVYYSFAMRAASKAMQHTGETLDQILNGMMDRWVTAFGADPAILEQIANLVKTVRG